ncbi:MAG: hypothetical protein GWM98_19880 [Nitrospinaceae bacterium]|nr:hypothetical protein [Nitrospinaceae bacterium]NIR56326.1 hypothetical protein [Nitrospinaceae bacterium]NIS86786.1 hypothetical protein [Nitrospinaceae bacterium]NIT83620.1 hypothetical protein [Nitrospinaceae bacterium]NIU45823.1 hypothetical protein [Nitrospinaceae bacterium]
MKYFNRSWMLCLLLVLPASSWAGEFKLYLDETRTQYVMAKEQDCSIYKTEDGRITLGFKAGNMLFEMGPEITFGKKKGIDWHHTVQSLIARYQELCTRFNTGALTKKEYEEHLYKIESIEKEAYLLYQKMIKEKEDRRQSLFDELDREAGHLESQRGSYSRINRKVDALKNQLP